MKKGLYLIVAIVLSVGSFEFIKRTFKELYYLRNFEYRKAYLSDVSKRNSIEADVSFDYTFDYQNKNKRHSFVHVANSDLGYKKGDSVIVRVSQVDNRYATFKSYNQQLLDLLLMILVIAIIVTFLGKANFLYLRDSKNKMHEGERN